MSGKFYIRKSASIGPLRLNASKSGIGTSWGIKGFRVGTRPNGSRYIHAGRYGIYYREELGKAEKPDHDEGHSLWSFSITPAVKKAISILAILGVLLIFGAIIGRLW
jgi:hypothetical protein